MPAGRAMRLAWSSGVVGACTAAVILFAPLTQAHAQGTRAELAGVWIVDGTKTENLKLTPEGAAAARNIVLAIFHPGALRPYIVNWLEVAGPLVARVHREIAARPGDEQLSQLLARVLAQPEVPTEWRVPGPGRAAPPILSVHLRAPTLDVKLFTMLTSIGTPLDVTAEEIHIESYFPADEVSDASLRAMT